MSICKPTIEKKEVELRKQFTEYIGADKEHAYYVYALCKDNVPFYIGKGDGMRIFSHADEVDILSAKNEDERKELTAKQKKIKELEAMNKLERVIVKYGLTEHEAFMVESALINICRYQKMNLTNIVNGHASETEKNCVTPGTKARELSEFAKECLPTPKEILDLPKGIDIKECAFISFNTLYPECKDESEYWDAIRGEWSMDKNKANKIRFVFAVHNQIVKGIYEVPVGKVHRVYDNYKLMPTLPYWEGRRDKEKNLAQKVFDEKSKGLGLDKYTICEKVFNRNKDLCKELGYDSVEKLKNWVTRSYFTVKLEEESVYLSALKESFMNRLLMHDDAPFKMPQHSVKFGALIK